MFHPLYRELFPLDLAPSLEHYGDSFSISFLLFCFSGSGNMFTYFRITLGGPITDIKYNKGLAPIFSGGYWRLGKHTYMYVYHIIYTYYPLFLNFWGKLLKISRISGNWTTFSDFSRENPPETNDQKYPLSRENENTHAAALFILVGGGRDKSNGVVTLSSIPSRKLIQQRIRRCSRNGIVLCYLVAAGYGLSLVFGMFVADYGTVA